MERNNPNDNLTLFFFLLIRQMGGLADCFRHVLKEDALKNSTTDGWRGYIQTELADTVKLVQKVCDLFELDYDEVVQLGLERDKEKAAEYLKRHPEDFWI